MVNHIDTTVPVCQWRDMTPQGEGQESIRAVTRAIDVLRAVNRLRGGTLAEISREARLPYATCFRIVQTLIRAGLVMQEAHRKRYHVTEMVLALSSGYQADDRLVMLARDLMDAFTARHLWPLGLAIRVGQHMMIRHSTHALTTQTFELYHRGDTQPIAESASGRVWLAYCGQEERDMVLEALCTQESDSRPGLRLLREQGLFETIRAQGHACFERTPFNRTPGQTSAIAVPLLWEGQVHGALAMVFFASAMPMAVAVERYAAPLKAVAAEVASRAVAGTGRAAAGHAPGAASAPEPRSP